MLYPSLNLQSPVLDTSLSRGLVGYWPLDDQGGIAYDRSGTGNHGTLVGDTHSVLSERGRCLSFDGTGDYVNIIHNSNLNLVGDFAISAWINNNDGLLDTIVSKRDEADGNNYWQFRIANGRAYFLINQGGSLEQSYIGTVLYNDSIWHHIVLSRNGTNVSAYNNGVLNASSSFSNNGVNSNNVFIGKVAVVGYEAYFNGSIDEVMIFNRSVSAQEIQQLYLYGLLKHRDLIELWTAASPTSGTIIPLIHYYNQQARA